MRRKGDCLGVLWQQFWRSGTGNGMKVGAWGMGFLVNVPLFTSRVGWGGTINFHFWESHSILLDFVEPIRVQGKKKEGKPESI